MVAHHWENPTLFDSTRILRACFHLRGYASNEFSCDVGHASRWTSPTVINVDQRLQGWKAPVAKEAPRGSADGRLRLKFPAGDRMPPPAFLPVQNQVKASSLPSTLFLYLMTLSSGSLSRIHCCSRERRCALVAAEQSIFNGSNHDARPPQSQSGRRCTLPAIVAKSTFLYLWGTRRAQC